MVTPLLERVVWQAAFPEELFEAVTTRSSRVEARALQSKR